MRMYIPKNKKTGQEYPPITEGLKNAWESNPATKGKYTFLLVAATVTEPGQEVAPKATKPKKEKAPEPIEAKRAEDMPQSEEQ